MDYEFGYCSCSWIKRLVLVSLFPFSPSEGCFIYVEITFKLFFLVAMKYNCIITQATRYQEEEGLDTSNTIADKLAHKSKRNFRELVK
jgi:hypothetical protein